MRIARAFKQSEKPLFIGFTVAGDPDQETSVRIVRALIDAGTDILELGVPFSDPVADGSAIQKADERSLTAGTTPDTVFALVRELRKTSEVPIVFLTYFNIVYRRGIDRFYSEAHDAGVDGILVADLPVEEAGEVVQAAERHGIDPVFLVTQTSSDERIKKIVSHAGGYLYLVSVLGVTGVRDTLPEEALVLLRRVRRHSLLPLAMGFGISAPSHVKRCAEAGAEGVIVGSAIVRIVEENLGNLTKMEQELKAYVKRMKSAVPHS